MATNLADIHPDLIQTHILPLLDGPSLSSIATASSYLQTLCTDKNLWSHICNSIWPSIEDPRLHDIISTFPAGHRSFFQDSFPALVTDVNNHNRGHHNLSSDPCPSQIISAVDIRYQNDIIYSKVEFTDTTDDFLSSDLRIRLNVDCHSNSRPIIFPSIDLEVEDLADPDDVILERLKESMSLNWILIYPNLKRTGNISSIKPVGVMQGWTNDDMNLVYATVLPGCDEKNKMVQCKIQVVVGVVAGSMGMQVKDVYLELLDLDFNRLKGRDFLVITQGALSEENNVRRKVANDTDSRRRHSEFMKTSINSLSHLRTEIQNDIVMPCNSFLQRLFHMLKVILLWSIVLFFIYLAINFHF